MQNDGTSWTSVQHWCKKSTKQLFGVESLYKTKYLFVSVLVRISNVPSTHQYSSSLCSTKIPLRHLMDCLNSGLVSFRLGMSTVPSLWPLKHDGYPIPREKDKTYLSFKQWNHCVESEIEVQRTCPERINLRGSYYIDAALPRLAQY